MLRADVVDWIDGPRNIGLTIEAVPGALAATLCKPNSSDYKYLDTYRQLR